MIFKKIRESAKSLQFGATSSSNSAGSRKEKAEQKEKENPNVKKNRQIVQKLLQYELVLIFTFSSLIMYAATMPTRSEPMPER
ncbi:hypothetical protein HDU97_005260 [Phlyctochytrium planicorne]|nr:hypothetical protein HDU97_005260 [Phlyctochytrium planicorne]